MRKFIWSLEVQGENQSPLRLIGSRQGQGEGVTTPQVTIHQDVNLYLARLHPHQEVTYPLGTQRSLWLQVAQGSLELNDRSLSAGDGVGITELAEITLRGVSEGAEALLFDLPA